MLIGYARVSTTAQDTAAPLTTPSILDFSTSYRCLPLKMSAPTASCAKYSG